MLDSNDSAGRHLAGQRELMEEFVRADRDGDGCIGFEEFAALMRGLDAGMSGTELRLGFHEVDTDGDGSIDFREFVAWWSSD